MGAVFSSKMTKRHDRYAFQKVIGLAQDGQWAMYFDGALVLIRPLRKDIPSYIDEHYTLRARHAFEHPRFEVNAILPPKFN